ncbi:hypothetical protein JNUCC0626_40235 [Lentzea sp. JNUCC 0626]|uniref:hypothetical protein n=1 Tax=Lentzea sp. JNUCC 0626 TaxID=3367513 RepID=UPI00374862BE
MPENNTVTHDVLEEINGLVGCAFDQMTWAEDEIKRAMARHPAEADTLYHAFHLLKPISHRRMDLERVYRAHCREMLDRVASGVDTRIGTSAEVLCLVSQASTASPLTTAAAGLYFRMFAAALPDLQVVEQEHLDHYEALKAAEIDDLESSSRKKLTDPDRVLRSPTCRGMHDGEPVLCKYFGDSK